MKRTYHGSCHCAAVTFEADIDLAESTNKCNCSFCWKRRAWNSGRLTGEDFRLLTAGDALGDYRKGGEWGESHHYFCRTCGSSTHSSARIEATGDEFFSVYLAALDDLPVDDLLAAPVTCMDGLHDDWAVPPAETRHL